MIGYDEASAIAHTANDRNIRLREAAIASGAIDAARFDEIVDPRKLVGDQKSTPAYSMTRANESMNP